MILLKMCKTNRFFWQIVYLFLLMLSLERSKHMKLTSKRCSAPMGKGAKEYESSFQRTDGFYTSDKNVLLTLMFADCVPLYFYAPKHGLSELSMLVGKAQLEKLLSKMVRAMQKEGVSLMKFLL